MSKQTVVTVENVTKSFKIPIEASNGLKQKLINLLKNRKGYREFTPLRNISFEVEKGEFFGIIGKNGSGKSTLLKTIAGIYTPNHGTVLVNGTLVPFIELGVGFNPELTGRENVFLNGALLGFSHKEMEAMYDRIVEFAELHDFMEERLKNYSSGMQVRLAFSIAIQAKGDILLLDEVLAVGDIAFQQKCYDYFETLKKQNKTVILVTHDMSAVNRFCSKALLINDGRVVAMGEPYEIPHQYEMINFEQKNKQKTPKQNRAAVHLEDNLGKKRNRFRFGEKAILSIDISKYPNAEIVGYIITRNGEDVYATNTIGQSVDFSQPNISVRFTSNIDDGRYKIVIGIFGKSRHDIIDFFDGPELVMYGQPKTGPKHDEWHGITYIESEWI